MSDSATPQSKPIDNFEVALRMRDFQITQLTTRNNFFMIFQGVLLAGLVQSAHLKPIVSVMVCGAGFMVALFQIGMACGAMPSAWSWPVLVPYAPAVLRRRLLW